MHTIFHSGALANPSASASASASASPFGVIGVDAVSGSTRSSPPCGGVTEADLGDMLRKLKDFSGNALPFDASPVPPMAFPLPSAPNNNYLNASFYEHYRAYLMHYAAMFRAAQQPYTNTSANGAYSMQQVSKNGALMEVLARLQAQDRPVSQGVGVNSNNEVLANMLQLLQRPRQPAYCSPQSQSALGPAAIQNLLPLLKQAQAADGGLECSAQVANETPAWRKWYEVFERCVGQLRQTDSHGVGVGVGVTHDSDGVISSSQTSPASGLTLASSASASASGSGSTVAHCLSTGNSAQKLASLDASPSSGSQQQRFQCDACHKSYSTFSGLTKHKQFHCVSQVKKQFNCKYCEKSYVSLGALKMHIRTHTLPCKCQICGKAFSRPWLLNGHIRTHTGEKPFKCEFCGRAFADRSNLRAHLQTHSDVKKYSCKLCQKTFSRMSLLVKHSETVCGGQHDQDHDQDQDVKSYSGCSDLARSNSPASLSIASEQQDDTLSFDAE